MSRFIDADALHSHPVMIVDSRTGKVKTEMVVFAREIDKAPSVRTLNGKTASVITFDEWYADFCNKEKEND